MSQRVFLPYLDAAVAPRTPPFSHLHSLSFFYKLSLSARPPQPYNLPPPLFSPFSSPLEEPQGLNRMAAHHANKKKEKRKEEEKALAAVAAL